VFFLLLLFKAIYIIHMCILFEVIVCWKFCFWRVWWFLSLII